MKGIFLGIGATIVLSIVAALWLNGSIQQTADQRYSVPANVRL